jgi:2-keto-4-pentenoate hydratase/2-oxohepta-3-ene-1,7-dioic acid hydratase in catechol pathway
VRWCRYAPGRRGLVHDGDVYDISSVVAEVLAGVSCDERGDAFVARLGEIASAVFDANLGAAICPESQAKFLSPVVTPAKIIGAPANYEEHLAEAVADKGISQGVAVAGIDAAGLFLKAPSSLAGPSEGIALRFPHRRSDHEVEVGVVIGRRCRQATVFDALDYVAGYVIAIDVTLRGPEDRSFRKSIDSYSVIGPYLVTPDEIGDPGAITFSLDLNGERRQEATTAHLIKDIPALISSAAEWYTLEPGDVLMTGTPAGVGPLQDGDVIVCHMADSVAMEVHVRSALDFR